MTLVRRESHVLRLPAHHLQLFWYHARLPSIRTSNNPCKPRKREPLSRCARSCPRTESSMVSHDAASIKTVYAQCMVDLIKREYAARITLRSISSAVRGRPSMLNGSSSSRWDVVGNSPDIWESRPSLSSAIGKSGAICLLINPFNEGGLLDSLRSTLGES
jgi:hypothetical protein